MERRKVAVDDAQLELIDKYCLVTGTPKTRVVREALADWVCRKMLRRIRVYLQPGEFRAFKKRISR